jgi:hypothetical protein
VLKSDSCCHGLRIFAVAAFLAGCGGSQPPIGAPGAMPQSPTSAIATHAERGGSWMPFGTPGAMPQSEASAIAVHAERGGSWMLPEAKSEDLLYISNVNTVTIYTYPRGKHVGTLKGFYRAVGECADNAGDVFIANLDTISEYQHGERKPIRTLSFSGYLADNCAVDPTSGALAVTWNKDTASTNYVAIYQHASGSPTLYTVAGMLFYFCGFDSAGDLFVDGETESPLAFALVELSNHGDALINIDLNQSIEFAGAVQWDGKYLAVGDDEAQKIYRFSISGSSGTLEGAVDLGDAQSVYQWVIDAKKVVGSDDVPSTVRYWHYPAGGSAIKSITKGVFHPYGATISKAPK